KPTAVALVSLFDRLRVFSGVVDAAGASGAAGAGLAPPVAPSAPARVPNPVFDDVANSCIEAIATVKGGSDAVRACAARLKAGGVIPSGDTMTKHAFGVINALLEMDIPENCTKDAAYKLVTVLKTRVGENTSLVARLKEVGCDQSKNPF